MPCKDNSSVLKVHISACPSERYLYFEEVLSYLSALEGIEVSFCISPRDNENNLPNDTTHLVILATEKYFTTKNSGYSSEYLKAADRGVTIIPLLFEEGIINLINTRFKKTQYIIMFDNFETSLQKLSTKLTEKHQENNDNKPIVFISYRRADKPYLDELIKSVIEFEYAENVFFWFDDNITPGDKYSNEISGYLESCKLFILLVTPNLFEDNNFVLRYEYPKAKKLKKKIIAVEAEKTDRNILSEKYPDIPNPINIKQMGAIESEILKIINAR